ncbi:MAG: hypothetical protein M0Z67_05100 [Nitrospiraceae bacterium]|nr:hypothetical protein [Nitrospiraceae bacterium]
MRIWLTSSQRLTALGWAIYDDRLFLNLGDSLKKGNWLGAYSDLTLAKGPFYPFWIAAMSKLGVSLLLSQHLLYVASCFLFVIAARPLLRTPLSMFLVFTVLIFNPMSYSQPMMTQVLREGIYPALTLFVVSCAVGLLVRATRPATTFTPWAAGLGLSLSAFLLTREEGIWISPFLFVVVGAAALRVWSTSSGLWRSLSVVVLPLTLVVVIMGCVAGMNRTRYGLFTVNELKSTDFLDAYGALLRVKHVGSDPVVPVPREVRSRIYAVSPAFAELRPFLEGDLGRHWLDVVKNLRKLYEEDPQFARKARVFLDGDPSGIWKRAFFDEKREIMGGWFIWAFRDAVAAAGYHSSCPAAAAYYRRLGVEVNAACAEGRLDCLGKRSTLLPPWRNEYAPLLLKTFVWGGLSAIRFEGTNVHSDPSIGDEKSFKLFRDVTLENLSPSEFRVQGWVFSPDRRLDIAVVKNNGVPVKESVPLPSPDVYAHFLSKGADVSNARNCRFDMRLALYSGACCLSLSSGGKLIRNIPLDGSVTYLDSDGLHFHLEVLGTKKDSMKLRVLSGIGRLYQSSMPILVILSLIGYAVVGILACRRRRGGEIPTIATALALAIIARLCMLAVIHVTSFPAIIPQYLAPLYPLLILFVALVLTDSCLKPGEMVLRAKKVKEAL